MAANVFRKPKTTEFMPYTGKYFTLLIPAKWNPSKEVEFPGQVLIFEDNFDTTSNLSIMVLPTDNKSITDNGSPKNFLSTVDYLLGKQAYSDKTASEGGFEQDVMTTANILETATPVVSGKQYYSLSVLTMVVQCDNHLMIGSTFPNGT